MRLKRESKILKRKAIASLRRSTAAFNSFEEDGRASAVLLHLQHSFEMLLKAALVQRGVRIFDPQLGQSIGFEKCVKLGREHVALTEDEAGTLRAIDALRDDEQHWFNDLSEGMMYAHARAGITLFDDLIQRVFDERLTEHLPLRVLPISAEPPREIQLLLDEEYTAIQQLLAPGRRMGAEARARIRSLLAMEAHVVEDVRVSKKDVDRVQEAVREGKTRNEVFPRLRTLESALAGDGISVTVRFTKREDAGTPVRFVAADDPAAAGAVREVDLQRKYHRSAKELADALHLSLPRSIALRRHLSIDTDHSCCHQFVFGAQTHMRFSDNGFRRMRDSLKTVDMDEIWQQQRPVPRPRPPRAPRVPELDDE